jgi:hypothetical protein
VFLYLFDNKHANIIKEPQKQNFKHQFYGHSFNVFNLQCLAENQNFSSAKRVKGLNEIDRVGLTDGIFYCVADDLRFLENDNLK